MAITTKAEVGFPTSYFRLSTTDLFIVGRCAGLSLFDSPNQVRSRKPEDGSRKSEVGSSSSAFADNA